MVCDEFLNQYLAFYQTIEEHAKQYRLGENDRLIFADWLEDQGEVILAQGQRWQVEQEKVPDYFSLETSPWTWFLSETIEEDTRSDHLSPSVMRCMVMDCFKIMTERRGASVPLYLDYLHLCIAEYDLARALHYRSTEIPESATRLVEYLQERDEVAS